MNALAPALREHRASHTMLALASIAAMLAGAAAHGQGARPAGTPPAEAAGADGLDTVVVTGRRVSEAAAAIGTDELSNTVAITREALLSAPAGVSGLKVLESLPGFNVQANDALGLYEFGNSVSVRAFNFQQIGFVLDGIPLGRSDQFGGSPIFRYVDNENLGRVTASQGAGDVSLPSYASLGPIVRYASVAPADEFGATLVQTFGSDALKRTFLKLETGELGPVSAYISRSKIDSDLWRGPGTIDREHYEGRIDWRIGADSRLSLKGVYNDFFDYDTPSISQAQYLGTANDLFGRSGRRFGYLGTVPDLPVTVPGVRYSNTAYNQYFQQAINQRTDKLLGLSADTRLGEAFSVQATAYYEDKDGYGVSPEAYATSLASYNAQRLVVPGLTAPRGLQYGLSTVGGDRNGLTGTVTWSSGIHRLSVGGWIEQDDYRRTQARFNQVNGDPAAEPLLNQPVHLQRDYRSRRDTTQLFVDYEVSLLDGRLSLRAGAKSLDIDYRIAGARNPADYIAGRRPTIVDTWRDDLLPQVGVVWSIGEQSQLFASVAENLALPRGADDIFSLASPAAPGPEAEKSRNAEIGVRTNRRTFNGALALYRTDFDNRLQSFAATVPGSTAIETFFQNVGRVGSWGAEFTGNWKPELLRGLAYFNANLSWNRAEFEDSYPGVNIAGKRVPDSAEWLAQGGVTLEPVDWAVVNLAARYVGSRYTNFTNSERIGGYTVVNAYVDLGGEDLRIGPLRGLKLRFNVDNLFDRDYLGTINATTTTLATFRPGPARTFQITATLQL